MGDRANIQLTGAHCLPHPLFFYTHWSGCELPFTLQSALKRGRERWNDPQYLTRIIFSEMIQGDVLHLTGYGISTKVCDGEDRVLVVDVDAKKVTDWDGKSYSFEEFCSLDLTQ